MKENIWTYLSAIASVAFGWLLNELSQMLRGRKEDRKIKKRVLFYLLELHFTLKQLDTTSLIEVVTTRIAERLPGGKEDNNINRYLSLFFNIGLIICKRKKQLKKYLN